MPHLIFFSFSAIEQFAEGNPFELFEEIHKNGTVT
jgi:hypothetical protein